MKFKTIKNYSTGIYKDKGSKFLSFAYPVASEDEVKDILQNLKKEHHGARHFCYAYRINPENIVYRSNDDGEPNHTAGTPILGQLLSFDLVNVLVVVVRYFGGTKLGVSGLIQAYKLAAYEALQAANTVIDEVKVLCKITLDYAQINAVMKILKNENVHIINQTSGLQIQLDFLIAKDAFESTRLQLILLDNIIFEA